MTDQQRNPIHDDERVHVPEIRVCDFLMVEGLPRYVRVTGVTVRREHGYPIRVEIEGEA